MKISLPRSALLAALGHVKAVVERRNTIPILSNVLLVADRGGLTLTATDLDIEIRTRIEATPEEPGKATVQAALLADIVRKLPDKSSVSLALAADGKTMRVSSGRMRMDLLALSPEDFPSITAPPFPVSFKIAPARLIRMLTKTEFAISTEETRYYLCGIYLHVVDDHLVAVATDGHRMARIAVDLPHPGLAFKGIIVPSKAVGRIRELAKGTEAELTIEISDSKIRASASDTVLTSKLIDGTFPDYQRVIPRSNTKTLTLDRAAFMAAVDRVSTVAIERGRAVKFGLGPDSLDIAMTDMDAGSGQESIDVAYEHAPIEIGFNSRYVADVLGTFDGDQVTLALNEVGDPALFSSPTEDQLQIVLMPMRV